MSAKNSQKHDVFISHSSEDSENAEKISFFLENNGMKCWKAPRDVKPGGNYPAQILEAIRNCHAFLLLASEKTNLSEHVSNEIERAFEYKKLIIPFMLQNIKFPDEQLYFLARKQRINAYENFEDGLENLLLTVSSYTQSFEHPEEKSTTSNVHQTATIKKESQKEKRLTGMMVLDGQQTLELFTGEQILKRCIQLDYDNIENLTEASEGSIDQWVELLKAFPETWRILLDNGEIVGYWHFVCLNNENFEKAKKGELLDGDINLDIAEYMLFPGDYKGYFVLILILPSYRNIKNFQLLMNSLIEQIEKFAENDIFISEWCVNAFTKEGRAMCKSLRLQYICDNILEGEIYFAEIKTILETPLFKNFPRLIELYKNHLQ